MDPGPTLLLNVVVALLLVVGLVGTLVPVIPGTALILGGIGLHAVASGFDPIGPWRLLAFGLLGALAIGLDYAAGALALRLVALAGVDGANAGLTFHGNDLDQASANAFLLLLDRAPAVVTLDVRKMTGYDPRARRAWQTALRPRHRQIKGFRFVGARGLVRLGASFLCIALGVPWEFVDSP